ncbi:hypothetical protein OF83DRAFT_1272611 [Amylostereum chailletii]|nr:hypothetical protein OF83DRAFT_1272611 [Amylostereum chailletii]
MTSYIQRVSVGSIDPYAIVIAHVQSSGTGKSRMHDELAKHIVYVPICLASHSQSAYPPPDRKIRNWLFDSAVSTADGEPDLPGTQKRLQGLVYAVLTVTKKHLVEIQNDPELGIPSQQISNIAVQNGKLPMGTVDADVPVMIATLSRLSRLASAFREKMSAGGSFTKHGEYREEFYKEVCRVADEFVRNGQPQAVNTDGSPTDVYSSQGGTVSGAADELRTFLDPLGLCGERLLAVICMDEAHKLTDSIHSVEWNRFTELRRPLRKIRHQPFATVFLSTTGSFHKFSQDNADETSSRLRRKKLALFDPITEVGFDQFAVKVLVGDSKWTLDRLASTHHIAHLGRALFATRYDTGSDETRRGIVAFAREKLLYGLQEGQSLNGDMKLACLSVRLGLEFKATNWAERTAERKQVENHMRVCLSATAGFHTMTTISPSEPLLAEAASRDMAEPSWNAPGALLAHIETSYLNPGDRGEVLATLILLLARDTAAKTTHLPVPVQGGALDVDGLIKRRVVSVPEFLGALFGDRGVLKMKPSKWMNDETRDTLLENAFGDGRIWFNHFAKVNDFNVLNRKYLAGLIARGAAVICANNLRGVDILIPILFGRVLDSNNISAILIQVKNDPSYTDTVKGWLFDGMDPFLVGLYPSSLPVGTPVKPVIRMVFALASSESATVTKFSIRRSPRSIVTTDIANFDAYDIWCAGTSSDTFGVIRSTESQTYDHLLLLSRSFNQAYQPRDQDPRVAQARGNARRSMHPGVGVETQHFENYLELNVE